MPAHTYSDLVAGYVTSFDAAANAFGLRMSDGTTVDVKLADNLYGELIRNLDEPYADCTAAIRDMLVPNRFLFAYGVFYPDGQGRVLEGKHLVFPGRQPDQYAFESQDWWVNQIRSLGRFYLDAEFPDGRIDFAEYTTSISLEGRKEANPRQECDTISRLVYGFASAYMLTGDEQFLEAAEKGTAYLRENFRYVDRANDAVYWYHAIDRKGGKIRKIFASEFGDDYNAIPAYEQIYALAGPVQTYRITGDPQIREDADRTINLFNKFYLDREQGGYFSHLDPITMDPRSEALGQNRARKNWNSVGDHAPAYLINLYLATGQKRYADMLVQVADIIEQRFPDYDHSPFVQEKFHADWSHDKTWGWQQDRGVVGHNLKIAWNLSRVYHLQPREAYLDFARKIAAEMPKVGYDGQRTGWYDVMERTKRPGEQHHRFAWHDRKAWWQQEQGILAYMIMAGSVDRENADYLRLARESTAFYNAFFLDHEAGAIYFNVFADGMPFLLGTERHKGSHSMAGYHSFELAFLAATYTNLLIRQQPLDLHFKPLPGGFADGLLRVAPDLLPAGSVRIAEAWVNGQPYADFDAEALTVKIPEGKERPTIKVRLVSSAVTFDVGVQRTGDTVRLDLAGKLDISGSTKLLAAFQGLQGQPVRKLELVVPALSAISDEGVRALDLALEKLSLDTEVEVVGAVPQVVEALGASNILGEVTLA